MFTGIIECLGRIVSAEDRDTTRAFVVEAEPFADAVRPGDSIAVDGACLTAVSVEGARFGVDVIGTTLERTVAGAYRVGSRVNLERAAKLGQRLDGHLVQGHVDGVGHLIRIEKSGGFWLLDVRVPREVADHTVVHGSIALNGVSLTVSEMPEPDLVRIGLIPFTWQHTNLSTLRAGEPLNVEGDLIGKYVGRMVAQRGS